MDPGKRRDELEMKTRKFNALRAKVSKLEKRMATLRAAPKLNERKIEGFDTKVVSNDKATTHLATFEKDHRLNNLLLAAGNGELRRRVNIIAGKTLQAVLFAK